MQKIVVIAVPWKNPLGPHPLCVICLSIDAIDSGFEPKHVGYCV